MPKYYAPEKVKIAWLDANFKAIGDIGLVDLFLMMQEVGLYAPTTSSRDASTYLRVFWLKYLIRQENLAACKATCKILLNGKRQIN